MLTKAFNEHEVIPVLIKRGALFICNHSGGKDSDAMYNKLRSIVPSDQLVVIHAHLPGVEWPGIPEHIKASTDVPYYQVQARKTFFEMVEHRQQWPSPKNRQCTSDLKRGPITKKTRELSRTLNRPLIVNCMGLRAEESPGRAKKEVWRYHEGNSVAGREWYEWLPIHDWSLSQVFSRKGHTVADWRRRVALWKAGRKEEAKHGWRFHYAYVTGMTRLSCCFCIMSSKADLQTAAIEQPELYEQYVDTEKRINHTFVMPSGGERKFLDEVVGPIWLPVLNAPE